MPAYYNEIDHYAAQWLRNLIVRGMTAAGDVDDRNITGGPDLLASNAFDQSARGTLGKEPRPFLATCNYERSATHHFVPVQVCALHPGRDFLRRPRRPLEHLDFACENVAGSILGTVLLSFSDDTRILVLDFSDAIRALSALREHADNYPSMFAFGWHLSSQRIPYHTRGIGEACRCPLVIVPSETPPHISVSRIGCPLLYILISNYSGHISEMAFIFQ